MSRDKPVSRRYLEGRPAFWIGFALVLLALWGVVGYDLFAEYQRVGVVERQRLAHQTQVVEESLALQLQTTGNAIDSIRADMVWLLAQPEGQTMLNSRLQAMTASMTGVPTFIVVNIDGDVIASNRYELLGQNFRDSERYRAIRQGGDRGKLYLSPPFVTPLDTWAMSAGKMISDASGGFNGYVLAILVPEYFRPLMRSALFAPDMRATLVHGDGKVILRDPDPEGLTGKDLSAIPTSLFAQYTKNGQSSGVFEGYSGATGQDTLVMMSAVRPESTPANKPLVFSLSRSRDAIYASWRKEALFRLTGLSVISVASLLALLVYDRRRRAFVLLRAEQEAERRAVAEQLLERDERLRLALEGAGMGTYHWNLVLGELAWSETFRELFGLAADVPQSYDNWLSCVHPQDRAAAHQSIQQAMANRTDCDSEYRAVWPDGSVRWLAAKGRFFYDADGVPQRMEGVVSDITGRKAAEQALRCAKAKAEAANEAKSAFLANMSHELRTPLNAVIGFVSLAQNTELSPNQQELLRKAQQSSWQLLGLIDDILNYVRLDTATLGIDRQDFELGAMLELVLGRLRDKAAAKGLTLSLEVAPDVPRLLAGDTVQMGQILHKLGDNAVKFTEAGSVRLAVRALERQADDVLLLFEIVDTGIGLDVAEQARLFQRFHQNDASLTRKHGGTGIGLAIARRLVELMGGQIGVESRQGVGSRFWFTVRLGVVQPASAGLAQSAALPGGPPVAAAQANTRALEAASGESEASAGPPLDAPQWPALREHLVKLLRDSDVESLSWCEQHAGLLRAVLGAHGEAVMQAVQAFDFEVALAELDQSP